MITYGQTVHAHLLVVFSNQSTSLIRPDNGNFTLTYADKTTLLADNAKDNFSFFDNGQFPVKNFSLQIALNASQKLYGQLGLGHYSFTVDQNAYVIPPFLNNLVSQGLTKTRLFSIFNKNYGTYLPFQTLRHKLTY